MSQSQSDMPSPMTSDEARYRLSLKSAEVDALRTTNILLADQLKSRWSLVEWWMKIMALLLTLVFGYQLWKAEEIRRESANLARITEQNTRLQSEGSIVSDASARVCSLLSSGYYDVGRQQYRRAKASADEALDIVRTTRETVGKKSDMLTSLSSMEFSCLALKARCCFSLRENDLMSEIAETFVREDPKYWMGYHFRGLCLQSENPASGEALSAFRQSLTLKPRYNIDLFNVVELQFALSKFDDAAASASQYLSEFPEHAKEVKEGKWSPTPVSVADIYYRICQLIKKETGSEQRLQIALSQIKSKGLLLSKSGWDANALELMQSSLLGSPSVTGLDYAQQTLIRDVLLELVASAKR